MGSKPTVMMMSPMTPEISPFITDFCPKLQIKVSPNSTIEKSSGAPKRRATLAIRGAANTRQVRPKIPPKNEALTATPSASPARPFCAMACPSIAVADAEGVPGMFKRMADKEPPVIPEA